MDDIASIITQQGEIARRRKLLEAMQGQNMQSGIVGSHRGAAIGQALAKVATAYMLGKQGEGLAQEETGNRGQYQQALQGELHNYLNTRDGAPSVPMDGPTQDGSQLMSLPVKGNPREAIVQAMASQFPELQNIGKADFATLRKDVMSAKDLAGLAEKFTPDSIAQYQQTGNPSVLRLVPKQHVVNNTLVNASQYGDGTPSELGYYGDKYGPDEKVNGEVIQREMRSGKAHQVANRPAQTNVSLSPTIKGEDAFASQLGKDIAGEVKVAREQALAGYNTMSSLKQLKQLDAQGVFAGPTANVATAVNALAQTFGVPVDEAKLANSQAYQQQLAQQISKVLTMGGGVGRSMTDEDRKAFEKSLPQLLLSPQGRQYVFNQMERDANIAIQRHKSIQQRLITNPVYKDFAGMLTINPVDDAPGLGVMPPTGEAVPGAAAGSGGVMKLDAYIQKHLQGG